ncbi:MAG TPA: CYTH domain-containing protein [Candidatus Hydrogenedentes bacterium]|nr:CYTH domain-containing protein [Candidatus Hydrogenedentota bacterium]
MRNIELKARLTNRERAAAACRELGAALQGDIHQRDTYFAVPEGRLKLRESDPGEDYLVFYHRPDIPGPKGCDYDIAVVDRGVRGLLCAALGTLAVVEKMRTLYLWKNVRIHLDAVAGCGDYLEFEAVLGPEDTEKDCVDKLLRLQELFGTEPGDLIETSYLEMALTL